MTVARPVLGRALVAAVVVGLAVSGCTSAQEVVVTVTTTPGAPGASGSATVTAPDLTTIPSSSVSSVLTSGVVSAPTSKGAPVRINETPAFGSTAVAPDDPFTLTVFAGTISTLTVMADDGTSVKGVLSSDKTTWTLAQRLAYGTEYTFSGTVAGTSGGTTPIAGKIKTVKPDATVRASIQIPSGRTVGVGAPIIITFATPIADKAAAEKTFRVTTDRGVVAGSWGWLQDEDILGTGVKQSIVHFRTAQYWPAYTKVHVEADLAGVNYGNSWGREDISSDFMIGRKQVVKADVNSFRLIVLVDDKVWRNYPVSYGKESIPGRNTVSGIHIVTNKYPTFAMCNPSYDYCNVTEHWAVRINDNGEFIHENPKAVPFLGKENISHGCINMAAADAHEYYNSAIYGDPVEVTGTSQPMSPADYIYDWIYSYTQWKTLSAL